jgi:dUTP pyrophosphatase
MRLGIKKLRDKATIPTKAHATDAGFDLYLVEDCLVLPNHAETAYGKTGLAIELPENTVGLVYPRSGIASTLMVTLPNSVGVIDQDYRGEIMIPLVNLSTTKALLKAGTRVAQLVVTPLVPNVEIEEVLEMEGTVRGLGGFGSTGA